MSEESLRKRAAAAELMNGVQGSIQDRAKHLFSKGSCGSDIAQLAGIMEQKVDEDVKGFLETFQSGGQAAMFCQDAVLYMACVASAMLLIEADMEEEAERLAAVKN